MINFPDSPTLNQVFSAVGCFWKWDGVKWIVGDSSVPPHTQIINDTYVLPAGFQGYVDVRNTANVPITVTLPSAPAAGDEITIKDTVGNATSYNITVNGAGKNIEGVATLVIRVNYNWAPLWYNGIQWVQV